MGAIEGKAILNSKKNTKVPDPDPVQKSDKPPVDIGYVTFFPTSASASQAFTQQEGVQGDRVGYSQ